MTCLGHGIAVPLRYFYRIYSDSFSGELFSFEKFVQFVDSFLFFFAGVGQAFRPDG